MIKIYNKDCIEGMKDCKSESFDVCITSPPYNLGNNHHTGNKRFDVYEDNVNENEYQNIDNLFSELKAKKNYKFFNTSSDDFFKKITDIKLDKIFIGNLRKLSPIKITKIKSIAMGIRTFNFFIYSFYKYRNTK